MNAIATEDNEKTNIRAKLESAIERAKDACERLEEKTVAATKPSFSNAGSTTNSDSKGSDQMEWETFAIWVFVAFSFAALVFAGYIIWAKCNGRLSFF